MAFSTRSLSVMVTRRCNMACTHCSVESSPRVKSPDPSERELLDLLRQTAAAGVGSVLLTGGEPMMRGRLVLRLLREARRLGLATALTTNGFWGRTPSGANRWVKALVSAGLGRLTVSYDRYHADFQGPEAVVHIVRAAARRHVIVNVNVTRLRGEDLTPIVAPFEDLKGVQLRFYDVQPVGAAARSIGDEAWRAEVSGFCNACDSPAITDDGRVVACNGPSYFVPPQNPLHVGTLGDEPLAHLLRRHREDPVLDTIRTFGPARLQRELRTIPGFEQFPFRTRYRGMCDLCHHIAGDEAAVAALREKLGAPLYAAERAAMQRIIDDQHRAGALNRAYVNTIGVARLFHQAAHAPSGLPAAAGRIVGRADLDWQHQALYLRACGLARPLLHLADDPELCRWAPAFFPARLREAAISDAMRELVQLDAIRRVGTELRAMDARGVLLKGTAMLALHAREPARAPIRAAGDIDLYVDARYAAGLRARLLGAGFHGSAADEPTGPHHLAPVSWQGVAVEIHTRIMPACWGLPEEALLQQALAANVDGFESLDTLGPEGLLLHTLTHLSTHVFTHGMKTAWDVAHLLDRYGATLDWDRLLWLVRACRVPRAFWVPTRVLATALDLPVPGEFLHRAPSDRRQRRLEVIAERRAFSTFEGAFELNPISRTAVFLLMHDGFVSRAGYLFWLLGSDAAASRRSAQAFAVGQHWRSLPGHIGDALAQWRQYRTALQTAREP